MIRRKKANPKPSLEQSADDAIEKDGMNERI
jgi:hypothetical protein